MYCSKMRYIQRHTYGNVRYIPHKQSTQTIDVTTTKLTSLIAFDAFDDECVDFVFCFAGSNSFELVATSSAA